MALTARNATRMLTWLCMAWFVAYLMLDLSAIQSGSTSPLVAAERAVPAWTRHLFMNITVQIALALSASILLAVPNLTARRVAPFLAGTALTLALIHVAIVLAHSL